MYSDSPWDTDPIFITEKNKPIEMTTENADFSEPEESLPEQKIATCSGSSGKARLPLSKEELLEFSHFKFKPLQTSDVCNEEVYDPEVLKVFSGLKRELITEMVGGACTLAKHRNSKEVKQEDLLLYLDMQWNIDPLLVSENYYRVEMPTKNVDLSIPSEPHPEQKTKSSGCSEKARQAASKQEIHNVDVLEKPPTATASVSKIMVENEFSIWDPEIIIRNPSHEMFHAYSKFGKKPVNKRKRKVGGAVKKPVKKRSRKAKVNRPFETPAEARKRMRQLEILSTVDTPAEARKRLAMILLRIAGKY